LNTRSEGQLAVLWSRIFKANPRTYPSERDAVLVKLADGRGVYTRLFSLDVPGTDDVDPDPVAAGRSKTVRKSTVSEDVPVRCLPIRGTHGAHSAAKFFAKLETAALDEL
jgi:hypothetical protein